MGSTNDRFVERAISFTGQKSGQPPETLQASDCELISNYLVKNGTLQRTYGDTTYASIGGSGAVLWMDRLRDGWIVQRGTSLYKESAENSASFSAVTGSVANEKIESAIYRGDLYLVNGTDQKVLPGGSSTLRELGLQSPISVLDSSSPVPNDLTLNTTGGTFVNAKTYKMTLTLFDPVNNVESPGLNVRPSLYGVDVDLSPDYWSFTAGAGDNDSITINQSFIDSMYSNTYSGTTLIDASRATYIRVYVSGASDGVNSFVFRLASEVAKPTSGGITITGPGTGVLLPTGNIPPVSALRQQEAYQHRTSGTPPPAVGASVYVDVCFFRDSLFGIGPRGINFSTDTGNDYISYDSILYIHEPFQPDYVFDTREIGNGDGQYAQAVAVLRDSVLLIFKNRSIYYLSGTSPDTYVVRVMDTRRGAVSPHTVQETPYGVFALDRSGVILVSSVGPSELITNDIEDVIRSINWSAIDTAYSSYDAEESRYYLSIPVDSSGVPNKTIVFKADEKVWSVLEGQEGASICFGVTSENTNQALIGASVSGSGRLARIDQETAVTISGGSMVSEYLSGPFFGGDPTKKKKAKFVYITAESASDWTVDIEIVPDFGQNQSFVLSNINSDSSFSVYAASLADSGVNVGVFDESLWSAGKVRKQLKVPVSCIGYGFQVRITNKSTDEDQYGFKIMALKLEVSVMGK